MALFKFLWLRRLVRRHTNPIPQLRAETWKRRLSVAYALLAWNAFGFVVYAVYTGKADWAKYHGLVSEEEATLTSAQYYAKTLGIKKATVYRMSGLDVTQYEINQEKESKTSKEGTL